MTLRLLALCACLGIWACGEDGGTDPGDDSNQLPQANIQNPSSYRVFVSGDQLTLTATSTDADGDPLTHLWALSGTAPGSLSDTTGATVTWTAPAGPGTASITLVSNDGTADSPVPARLDLLVGVAVPGGDIPDLTNWTLVGGPYVVSSDIRLPAGASLQIDAGVQVFFRGTMGPGGLNKPSFEISGVLRAFGTSTIRSQAVSLRGGRNQDIRDGAQWSGLLIESDGATPLQLNFCRVEEAETGIVASGTAELRLYGGILSNNISGISCVDPDGTTPGQGIVSTTILRRVRIADQLAVGIQAGSSTVVLRQCSIANNAAGGLSIQAATDPAVADLDSCRLELNGGSGGSSLSFDNPSGGTFALRVWVKHSNFRADSASNPNNVDWGGCNVAPSKQDFDLRGNFWAVTTNQQSALNAEILPTMSGYGASCSDDASQWLLSNGDWAISAHGTGAP